MNTASLRVGLVRLVGLGALAGLTVLLTLLFSFLGNLTCAVVAGMILGSGRRWQWDAIPISFVFPAVILSLSHYSKVELPPSKIYLIALVSGGAFWGVLGLMFGFRFLERKGDPVTPIVAGIEKSPEAKIASVTSFDLAALRGSWTCEESNAAGAGRCKTLHIEDGKFVLTERKARGRERTVAKGEVNMRQGTIAEIVFTSKTPPPQEH